MGLSFKKLSKRVGAEVQDFDVADLEIPENAEILCNALAKYNLLKFSLPNLSAENQAKLAGIFGKISFRGEKKGDSQDRLHEYVSNTRLDGTLGNGPFHFHHDHLFYEQPLTALMLYGMEIPESGTVTKFRDAHGFYEKLPDQMKAKLQGIDVLHMLDFYTNEDGTTQRGADSDRATAEVPQRWRPLVDKNPLTNEAFVTLSPAVEGFRGVSNDEGFEILRELFKIGRYQDDPDTTYAHVWTVGDLVVWDNIAVSHARPPFDSSQPRTLRRTPIIKPFLRARQ